MADNVVAARQLSLRGMDAMHHGKWDEAEQLFATAVRSCPVDERAHQHYAETLWRRGARGEAIEHMETAVRLSGNDPKLLVRIGQMHLATGHLPVASGYAESAVRSNRQLGEAWALKGDVANRSGGAEEALACYHRALSLDENLPDVPRSVAEIYLRQSNPQRALATVQVALDKFPQAQIPADLLRIEGLALKSLGRYDDAAEVLAAAVKRGAGDQDLFYELGHARLLAGDPSNARVALNEALKLNPSHPASLRLWNQLQQATAGMATIQR